jgi:ADP-ribose pyrophosphatase YjhB (NUDIX family)
MIVIVCSALITRNNKVLLVQESKMDKLGLPGGKLEAGESLQQCLTRELDEEIGAKIAVGPLVMISQKPKTHEGNTVLRFIYTADVIEIADQSELTYDYYDQSQIAETIANAKLRGKDVEHLLHNYFESTLETITEPLLFA